MALPTTHPAAQNGRGAVVIRMQRPHSRLRIAVAGLLTGLSPALPAVLMVFLWPRNRESFHPANGWWEGEVWWGYVFGGIALSLVCGLAGKGLAARTELSAHPIAAGSKTRLWPFIATGASLVLSLAVVALVLGPIEYLWASNLNAGVYLVLGGLAGIAVAAVGLPAADPVFTRKWLRPFGSIALVLAVLGDLFTIPLFWFLTLHNL